MLLQPLRIRTKAFRPLVSAPRVWLSANCHLLQERWLSNVALVTRDLRSLLAPPRESEVNDGVENDRGIHHSAGPEAPRIGTAYVRRYQVIEEGLLTSAKYENRFPPVCPKSYDDHEDSHQSEHDAPVLQNDGVVLDERD
jgi:hypothetical protein